MLPLKPVCPKCKSAMEPGFVVDNTYGGATPSSWVDGEPERSFWTGVKLKGHDLHPMTSFRCPECWYVEMYAPPAS